MRTSFINNCSLLTANKIRAVFSNTTHNRAFEKCLSKQKKDFEFHFFFIFFLLYSHLYSWNQLWNKQSQQLVIISFTLTSLSVVEWENGAPSPPRHDWYFTLSARCFSFLAHGMWDISFFDLQLRLSVTSGVASDTHNCECIQWFAEMLTADIFIPKAVLQEWVSVALKKNTHGSRIKHAHSLTFCVWNRIKRTNKKSLSSLWTLVLNTTR